MDLCYAVHAAACGSQAVVDRSECTWRDDVAGFEPLAVESLWPHPATYTLEYCPPDVTYLRVCESAVHTTSLMMEPLLQNA